MYRLAAYCYRILHEQERMNDYSVSQKIPPLRPVVFWHLLTNGWEL